MDILKTPITINGFTLSNRLVMPPMATAKAGVDGLPSESLIRYYEERAKGGYIGLIITEHSYISQEGKAHGAQLSIADNNAIPKLRELVSAIHQGGTRVFAQLNHAGGAADSGVAGMDALAPSAVRSPRFGSQRPEPREMTKADIQKVINDFTKAAERAVKAGYDGVEIHSAHGYLLNQFYSPLTNRREDEYGGNALDGRIKLHLEIIASVRRAVGAEYPLALRLGGCDYMDGGTTIEDSAAAAREFENAGVDLLDISGGLCGYINPLSKSQGYFSEISKKIKECVSIPVILTGGITDTAIAEKLLEEKKADLIGVGRAIMIDPNWAKRAITGE